MFEIVTAKCANCGTKLKILDMTPKKSGRFKNGAYTFCRKCDSMQEVKESE